MWLYHRRRKSPHFEACQRGARIGEDEAVTLEHRIASDPYDLDARLALVGHAFARRHVPHPAVLWLIDHDPTLDLGHFWGVDIAVADIAREKWTALLNDSPEVRLFANAAWSLGAIDLAFAERMYELADGHVGDHDRDYWYRRAAFFEVRVDAANADPDERQRAACALVKSLALALLRESDVVRRIDLTFPLRFAAPETRDRQTVRLTWLADAEARTALDFGCGTPLGLHRVHTLTGLIALVLGDRQRAVEELGRSTACLPTPGPPPSPSLEREIAIFGKPLRI